MATFNLGNVVGLVISEVAPAKKYLLWGKILDPTFPDRVQFHIWDQTENQWVPKVEGSTLSPVSSLGPTDPSTLLPVIGESYLVPVGATGQWVGKDNYRAEWNGNLWVLTPPKDGYLLNVTDEIGIIRFYEGNTWIKYQGGKFTGPPQSTLADLKAIDTTSDQDYPDKITIYVEENNGIYGLDRQDSSSVDDGNLVIDPTTGPGRWLKTSSSINDHNELSNLQGGNSTSNEYYHLEQSEYDKVQELVAAATTEVLFGTDINGSIVAYGLNSLSVSLDLANSIGLSLSGNVLSSTIATGSVGGMLSAIDWNTFNDKADGTHSHDASEIVSGTFADARISASNVSQHVSSIDHDQLNNYNVDQHRVLDDALTSLTTLWSSNKIKQELNLISAGFNRRGAVKSIIDASAAAPSNPNLGDRYILGDQTPVSSTWSGAGNNDIVEYNGTNWTDIVPVEGYIAFVDDINSDALFVDDGTPTWEIRSIGITSHSSLQDLGNDDHLQYHTDARANIWFSTKNTDNLAEGANKYFTENRVLSTQLAGFSAANSTAVTSADSVITALGKIQGQINSIGAITGSGTVNTLAFFNGTSSIASKFTVNGANALLGVSNIGKSTTEGNIGLSNDNIGFLVGSVPIAVFQRNNTVKQVTFGVGSGNDTDFKISTVGGGVNNFYVNATTGRIGIGRAATQRELEVEGDIDIKGKGIFEQITTGYNTSANFGHLQLAPSSTSKSHLWFDTITAVDPSSPSNGMMWATSSDLKIRLGNTTYSLVGSISSGDVTGPSSSVANELAVYNGTTGKIIKGGTGIESNGVGSLRFTSSSIGSLAHSSNSQGLKLSGGQINTGASLELYGLANALASQGIIGGNSYQIAKWDATATGAFEINPNGEDHDFIVRDTLSNNIFHVDAATGRVGVGAQIPNYRFCVDVNTTGMEVNAFTGLEFYHQSQLGLVINNDLSTRVNKLTVNQTTVQNDALLSLGARTSTGPHINFIGNGSIPSGNVAGDLSYGDLSGTVGLYFYDGTDQINLLTGGSASFDDVCNNGAIFDISSSSNNLWRVGPPSPTGPYGYVQYDYPSLEFKVISSTNTAGGSLVSSPGNFLASWGASGGNATSGSIVGTPTKLEMVFGASGYSFTQGLFITDDQFTNGAIGSATLDVDGDVRIRQLALRNNETKLLVADSLGDVYYRDVSSIKSLPNTYTTGSAGSISLNSDTYDTAQFTAQTTGLTISSLTGSPVNGQKFVFRIKGNSNYSITFGSQFREIGVNVPNTLIPNKNLYVGTVYNSSENKWDILAVNIEA